ncbi:MAG: CPBP family intramembrane glutamic endopeptidase [Rhodospirillaceae bacterium]
MARIVLLLEFLGLFGAGPLLVLALRQRLLFVALLWLGALLAWSLTRDQRPPPLAAEARRRHLRAILLRAGAVALALGAAVWLVRPELLLSFPRERPWVWLAVITVYPLLSVWPQEMLYRRFLLLRYAPLFGTRAGFVAASGLAFGYAHVIFVNPLAIVLSTAGGLLFAATFARHRSLALVWLEHALYGGLIFTIGLGRFFFTGAMWHP